MSRLCFGFQVILVILSGKFCFVEEVDLSFNSEMKPLGIFYIGKETVKTFFNPSQILNVVIPSQKFGEVGDK